MENKYAKQRIIKDVRNDDTRIQITDYVKRKESDYIILDDTMGEMTVNTTNALDFIQNIREKDLVNVIGDLIINMDGEKTIQADIIQDMNKLNFDYYLKLYELKKKLIK